MPHVALADAAWDLDPREVPVYSVGEAARYLNLPASTLSSWVKGRDYIAGGRKKRWEPLIQVAGTQGLLLSFNNLVEAHVLKAIRTRHGVPMRGVLVALNQAREVHGIERLFLSDELRTVEHRPEDPGSKSVGALFLEKLGEVEQISEGGQLVIRNALTRHLERIERDQSGMPVRLFPFVSHSSERDILIDPRVAYGRPVLVKRGIRVSTLADRIEAGESIEHVADNYGLDPADIERALDFFEQAA
ncbi:MAG TPA: DUF433 domain-containing protein [Thermoanaerobaculia bacterium]|jgi:uncharacterized protein (DUF433 family)|nr:DUF433 domain-containing protein [Thermoanaerobaculia bacterium]